MWECESKNVLKLLLFEKLPNQNIKINVTFQHLEFLKFKFNEMKI
jgi:hypothetical protein